MKLATSVVCALGLLALSLFSTAVAAPARGEFVCVTGLEPGQRDFLSLREKPSGDSGEIARLPAGAALQIAGETPVEEWLNVVVLTGLDSKSPVSGWVSGKFLQPVENVEACKLEIAASDKPAPPTPVPAPAKATFACVAGLPGGSADFLTLRAEPTAKAGELARLALGAGVVVNGSSDDGNWMSVAVPGGRTGWVSAKYLNSVQSLSACKVDQATDVVPPVSKPAARFACVANLPGGGDDFLSLRAEPSAKAKELARIGAGSPLSVVRQSGAWAGVEALAGQGTGWVSAKYLRSVTDPKECGFDVASGTKGEDTKPGEGKPDEVEFEKGDDGCDEAAVLDAKGNPVFPAGATDIGTPQEVELDNGLISDLYPTLDTTTDEFYAKLPCEPSIGGELPADVDTPPTPDEVELDVVLDKYDGSEAPELAASIAATPPPALPEVKSTIVGPCMLDTQVLPCDSPRFLRAGQPFEGRDIIYVHGLSTKDLDSWLNNVPQSHQPWLGPQDPGSVAAYIDPNGYFRQYAVDYWRNHIRENLFDPDNPGSPYGGWQFTPADSQPVYVPKSNRYLLIAWSSNNTIEYAQHALLSQIQMAITEGTNVVTPPTYPAYVVRPFCSNGCMIISHSTGALITSSALGLAADGVFGEGGKEILDHIYAHVSFEGANSGSRLGTLGLAVAAAGATSTATICAEVSVLIVHGGCAEGGLAFLAHSILRDLVPVVSQGVWGRWVAQSPVPTITVAGGHPIGRGNGLLKWALPGLDDGIVSMNSACGNPNPVIPGVLAPSGATVTSLVKAFDFSDNGGRLARAVKNFISHKNLKALPPGPRYLASGCTPYVTPTGMVMPVASAWGGTPYDARRRYRNYFSFIQATLAHSYDGGGEQDDDLSPNPSPSSIAQPASVIRHYLNFFGIYTNNVEETLAVTDSRIYRRDAQGVYLVKPIPVREVVKGKPVRFKLFGKRHTWWIWKRTYHLLDHWEVKQDNNYVYEFVARR